MPAFAEDEPLPGDWKRMPEFDRLLLFRALRPDRLTAAMRKFVTNMIGAKYVTSQPYDLERSFQDSSPGTPIFVFLSPGVDVVSDVALVAMRPRLLTGLLGCLLHNCMWETTDSTTCMSDGQSAHQRFSACMHCVVWHCAGCFSGVSWCQVGLHSRQRALRCRQPGTGPGAHCDECTGACTQKRWLGSAAKHPSHYR